MRVSPHARSRFTDLAKVVWRFIPEGSRLPDTLWRQRHRGILVFLWIQALGIVGFSLYTGNTLAYSLVEGGIIAGAALAAAFPLRPRPVQASVAAFGLIASSAVLVHLSGGQIEFHFHFFVMVGLLALYQEWAPFLLAIAFVLLHHGAVGVLDPSGVYNHPAAIAHPWRWAAIHAVFIAAMSVVSLITWRVNETTHGVAQLLLSSAGEGIVGLDPGGRVRFVNDAAVTIFAWDPRRVLGMPIRALLSIADDHDRGRARAFAAVGTIPREGQETFRRPDGTTVPVEYVSTPSTERGRIVATVLVLKDVTERQRLFQESERRRRAAEGLADVSRLISQSLDPQEVSQRIVDSIRTFLSARTAVVYRLAPEWEDLVALAASGEFGDGGIQHLVFPTGVGGVGLAVRERQAVVSADVLADPRILMTPDFRSRVEQGGSRSVVAVPLMVQGRVIGALGVGDHLGRAFDAEDIRIAQAFADQAAIAIENARLHKETQERLVQSETLLTVSHQVSGTLDVTEMMRRVAREACHALGADMVGAFLADAPHGHLRPIAGYHVPEHLVQEFMTHPIPLTGHRFFEEAWHARQAVASIDVAADPRVDQELLRRFPHRSSLFCPMIVQGEPIGGFFVTWFEREHRFTPAELRLIEGISRQAAIALENSRLYQEVRRAFDELSRTQDQLVQAQKMDAIGQLAGGIAHDFNNLLTVIIGRSRLFLGRVAAGDPGRRDVELIRQTADRAAALTRQLLAFSRKQVLQPRPIDLNALVGGLAPMLRQLIGEHIDLVIMPGSELGQVLADPGQLEQVIMNLVVNARDAMLEGGRLRIATENRDLADAAEHAQGRVPPGRFVALMVQDSGCGMDSATLSKMFEPFFTTKESGKGTGLGLSTAYGIVCQSGGCIGVDSTVGHGTTVTIYLPQVAARSETPEAEANAAPLARGQETILLVEDEVEVRRLASDILKACGYTVFQTGDPLEALVMGERHRGRLHLLLTDMVMPVMRGPSLAAQILARSPDTRVLYMSGYTGAMIGSGGTIEPAGSLLQKPFTPEVLARMVREALDAVSPHGSDRDATRSHSVTLAAP